VENTIDPAITARLLTLKKVIIANPVGPSRFTSGRSAVQSPDIATPEILPRFSMQKPIQQQTATRERA
jgi:hypothetical protein